MKRITALLAETQLLFAVRGTALLLGLVVAVSWLAVAVQVRPARQILRQSMQMRHEGEAQRQATLAKIAAGDLSTQPRMRWGIPFPDDVYEEVYNFQAMLPPAPLPAVGVGASDPANSVLSVQNHNDEAPSLLTGFGRTLSNVTPAVQPKSTLASFFGSFDLVFVTVTILPLLLIAFSYDAIATDEENGTLALMLAQGSTVRSVLCQRMTVRWLLFSTLVGAAHITAIVTAQVWLHVPLTWERLGWWVVAVELYLTFWFALSLFVQSLRRSAFANALTLVAAWTMLLLIIPTGVGVAARTFTPAYPSVAVEDAEKEARELANEGRSDAIDAMIENFARKSGVDVKDRSPQARKHYFELLQSGPYPIARGFRGVDAYYVRFPVPGGQAMHMQQHLATVMGRDMEVAERMAPVLRVQEAAIARQRKAVRWMSLLSPALISRALLWNCAGSDSTRSAAWLDQFDSYMHMRERFFGEHTRAYTPVLAEEFKAYSLFHFVDPPPGRAVLATGALYLFVCAATLCLSAFRKLARYPGLRR